MSMTYENALKIIDNSLADPDNYEFLLTCKTAIMQCMESTKSICEFKTYNDGYIDGYNKAIFDSIDLLKNMKKEQK